MRIIISGQGEKERFHVCPPPPHWSTSQNSLASLAKISNSKMPVYGLCASCASIISIFPGQGDKKTRQDVLLLCPRTYSQDVLGHSWPNGGPSVNKQMCNSSSRHLLYFKIARISLGCLDYTPFTMTKSLKNSAGRLVGMSPDMQ